MIDGSELRLQISVNYESSREGEGSRTVVNNVALFRNQLPWVLLNCQNFDRGLAD